MTQRRRFFAATPVQTVPGQTVAVEVQLRRNALAPVSAPVSVPATATWLLPQVIGGRDVDWQLEEDAAEGENFYLFEIHRWGLDFQFTAKWQGQPEVHEIDGPLPIPSADFVCYEVTVPTNYSNLDGLGRVFFGVLQGATLADVYWELAWDKPWAGPDTDGIDGAIDFDPDDARYAVSLYGARASAWANMVMVVVHPTNGGASDDVTLIATAYSAGVEVARLTFVATSIGY